MLPKVDYQLVQSGPDFISRLQECMGEFPTAYAFHKATKFPKGTIKGYLKGSEPGRKKLGMLASALEVSPAWLAFGMGDKRNEPGRGWVPVPELGWEKDPQSGDLIPKAGEEVIMVRERIVSESFLGANPGHLVAFRMPDSLLARTISMNEWTILNLGATDPGAGGTFCVAINGTVTIRHLGLSDIDHIRVSTDDPLTHPPFDVPRKGDAVKVFGRAIIAAVWVARTSSR